MSTQIYRYIAPGIFFVAITIAIGYFWRKHVSHRNRIHELIQQEIHGRIGYLKDLNRGSYTIGVGKLDLEGLPIAYEIEKYNIMVGDSVSKSANSNVVIFYQLRNGEYSKCFEHVLSI